MSAGDRDYSWGRATMADLTPGMSTYSYGNAAYPLAWPTDDPEVAHSYARAMSASGEQWHVHEYPPGGPQPGRLIAAYLNGEIVQPGEGA